jgi:hypothetical protein
MTCRLCLKGSNRNTLTNQLVHERTFTYVGIANDIHESCFMHQLSIIKLFLTIVSPFVVACAMYKACAKCGEDDVVTLLQV